MEIPKIISKNNREYILEKQCNKNLFLYRNIKYGYSECFTIFDLGLLREVIPAPKTNINPEKIRL